MSSNDSHHDPPRQESNSYTNELDSPTKLQHLFPEDDSSFDDGCADSDVVFVANNHSIKVVPRYQVAAWVAADAARDAAYATVATSAFAANSSSKANSASKESRLSKEKSEECLEATSPSIRGKELHANEGESGHHAPESMTQDQTTTPKGNNKEECIELVDARAAQEEALLKHMKLMETFDYSYGPQEAKRLVDLIKRTPETYINSTCPLFQNMARAFQAVMEATAQVEKLEQAQRDASMTLKDLMVEFRKLKRKQDRLESSSLEIIKNNELIHKIEQSSAAKEMAVLHSRIDRLEAVLAAVVTLPQLSRHEPDFEFVESEVLREAQQGQRTTLLRHAVERRMDVATDFLLEQDGLCAADATGLVMLNPPEKNRKYNPPKTDDSVSSVFGCANPMTFKGTDTVVIDAGRRVMLRGFAFKIKLPAPKPPNFSNVVLNFNALVSDDGNHWTEVSTASSRYGYQSSVADSIDTYVLLCDCNKDTLKRCNIVGECFNTQQNGRIMARYIKIESCTSHGVGLMIEDDGGAFLEGAVRIRDTSPLCLAATNGDVATLKKLLGKGASLELRSGVTKLKSLFYPGHDANFRIGHGFDDGCNALQCAAAAASLPAVKCLIEAGADVTVPLKVPTGREGDRVAGFLQISGCLQIERMCA